MTPAGGEAQQIAGSWILGGEDCRFSERLKCQNSIQFEKLWNVFLKVQIGKGVSADGRTDGRQDMQWAMRGSNPRPRACEARALTN